MYDYDEWEKEDLITRIYELEKKLKHINQRASENASELAYLQEEKGRAEQYERSKQGIYG